MYKFTGLSEKLTKDIINNIIDGDENYMDNYILYRTCDGALLDFILKNIDNSVESKSKLNININVNMISEISKNINAVSFLIKNEDMINIENFVENSDNLAVEYTLKKIDEWTSKKYYCDKTAISTNKKYSTNIGCITDYEDYIYRINEHIHLNNNRSTHMKNVIKKIKKILYDYCFLDKAEKNKLIRPRRRMSI